VVKPGVLTPIEVRIRTEILCTLVRMAELYRLTATPFLLLEGEFKGHLETVTFIATSERETQEWWSVNVGSYETDFSKLVHPLAAKEIVNRLRSGETVEFPGRYGLSQLKGFGGSWGD
jgi:hypothetical protein